VKLSDILAGRFGSNAYRIKKRPNNTVRMLRVQKITHRLTLDEFSGGFFTFMRQISLHSKNGRRKKPGFSQKCHLSHEVHR
jgi:hypothetical protein